MFFVIAWLFTNQSIVDDGSAGCVARVMTGVFLLVPVDGGCGVGL